MRSGLSFVTPVSRSAIMHFSRLVSTFVALALVSLPATLRAQAPNISATKSDGTPAATKKNPGDTVTYTNTITNSGGGATGVTFTDPDMAGAVVQNGTLKVSPIAFDDVYSGTIGSGVGINTNTATEFSVTANDYVGVFNNNPGTITITAFDGTSANGGTVTMVTSGADMGKFTYVSAAGYTGPDSFTYTISNTGFTATGTVSLTVSGPGMFFVSTTGNDTTGNGTLAAPFATLTKAATLDTSGDRIFLFSGAYTAGMTMETGEHLIGQGIVGTNFDTEVTGAAAGADSAARPAINGTKPTITTSSGNVINLAASGNVIRGVTINSTVSGYAVAGTGTNTLQIGSSSAGAAAADTVLNSSGSGGGCLYLTGAASGTVTVTGQINASSGIPVVIGNRTGGTTSFIGKVNSSSTAVLLSSNTGTTINFRCLSLNTGPAIAFAATGGGTLNITNGISDAIDNDGDGFTDEADEANTITTTTGTALNVADTTIGASGLTFRRIQSIGVSANSAIVLNNTGTTGGLTVTGGGVLNSGGVINGKTTSGIVLNSTAHLNLSHMTISSNGDAIDENGIRATNLFGACSLTNVAVSNNFHANVYVKNSSGATPLTMTASFCTFGFSVTHDGFDFFADPSGVASPLGGNMTLAVSNSFFNSNFSDGLFGGVTSNTTTGPAFCSITATTSTFDNNGANGIAIVSAGSSDTKFNLFSNTISGNPTFGINLFQNNGSTSAAKLRGVVDNNTITYSTTGGGGACLLLNTQGAGSGTVEITNNIMNYNNGGNAAFIVQSGDGLSPGVLNVKTTGNTINVNGANPLRGVTMESGITSASTRTVNWHPGVAGSTDDTTINRDAAAIAAGVIRIQVRKRPNSFFNIHNLSPSPSTTAGQVQAHLSSVMGITPSTDIIIGVPSTYQINYLTAVVDTSAATGAPLMFASGGVQPSPVFEQTDLTVVPIQVTPAPSKTQESPLATVAAEQAAPALLTQVDLDNAVASALERWISTGLTGEQIDRLKSLSFEISSLPGLHLGEAGAKVIRISSRAGGNGWFMDASTASDALFSNVFAETRRYTEPTAAPAGRVDLLTTVMHEMGHALGLSDSYNLRDRNSLMYGHLTTGERRYPSKGQARGAAPFKGDSTHFLSGAVNIGVLPPGKSVTITYDVIVNNPATTAVLSSQATVSGGNFASVQTDDLVTGGDPLIPGAADPTVTLIELPDVSVAVSPASVVEDSGSPLTYTFTRTGSTAAAMSVNFNISGSGVNPVNDITIASGTGTTSFNSGSGTGTIIIPIGSSTGTLTVTPTAEAQVEANETVVINVASGTGYDVGTPGTATGTINNDDVGIQIDNLPDSSLFEDQTLNFSYTFRRIGLTTGTTTANFSVGGSATVGTDYAQSGATTFTTTSGSVVFAPGVTTVVVTLDPTNDNLVEGNETITLTATAAPGYSVVAPTSQTATIVDDDVNVSLTSVVPSSVAEDSGTGMVYTFTRSGGSVSNALTVNVSVSGAATFNVTPALSDYAQTGAASFTASSGTITFAGGVTTKTVTITPTSDVTSEPDETVILTVAANGTPAVTGGYAVGGTPTATGTILNDDTQVSVAVAPTPVGEGSGTGMVYTFTRTGSTAAALPINFTKGGTATVTADFSVASSAGTFDYGAGTLTIPIGSSTATVTLTPAEDAQVEGSETATLAVAAGSGYGVSGSPATGTLTDNDTATIGFVTTTSTVGEATADDVQQLVLLINATGVGSPTLAYPVTVTVTGPSGTATTGTDYTLPTNVTFAANSLTAAQVPASIAITNDRAVEGSETAGLVLAINTDGTGGAVTIAIGAAASHTTTITDNDTATVSYTGTASSVGEAAVNDVIGLTLTVTGNGSGSLVLERSASFNVTTTGGTATNGGTDYSLPAAVMIPATTLDAAVTNFNLPIANDQLVEGSETAILGLTLNADNTGGQITVGAGNAHTATITDNDAASITFASPTSNVAENAGPDVMNLVLTIVGNGTGTAQLASAVSVNVTDAGGGTAAGAGVDFTLPTLVTFPANSLSASTQPASLGITNDLTVEASETVNLGLAINNDPTSSATIGAANAHTTTILDNDTASITLGKITDGNEAGPVSALFRVTQTLAASVDTVISYTVGGTATSGSDFTAPSGSVTILAGATTADISVAIANDTLVEATETVSLTLTGVTTGDPQVTLGATTLTASADITDNDTSTVTLAKINDGAEPATNGLFRVTQTAQASVDTVIAYTVAGSATSGTDFTALSGSVTILAGQTTADITVPVLDDLVVEATETVIATVTGITASDPDVSLGITLTATADITDNDTSTVTLAKINDGAESGTNGLFRVTQTAQASVDTVITYSVGGSATSGSDYTALSGNVTIAAGSTTADISVPVLDDLLVEATETVVATLTGFNAGDPEITLGAPVAATVNIAEDDLATVTLAKVNDGAEAASPTNALFRVTQTATSSTDTVLTYSIGGTATSGTDYTALSGSVTITAGQTNADITAVVLNENVVEASETLLLTLTGITSANAPVTLGATVNASADITNDDSAVVAVAGNVSQLEGSGPQAFSITLSNPVDINVMVNFATSNGTAIEPGDYTAASGTATFVAGSTTAQVVNVAVANDSEFEGDEIFDFTLSGLSAPSRSVTLGTSAATGTIQNDDTLTISITATDDSADENTAATGTWRVSRNGTLGAITANLEVDLTSTALAADWTQIGASFVSTEPGGVGTVTIPDGQSFIDIVLTPIADVAAEADETVQLNVTAGTGYTASNGPARTVTIARNDFGVTNTDDSGEGSLRQAIDNANVIAGTDTITFEGPVFSDAAADTITLAGTQIQIVTPVVIQGPGADLLRVSGNNASRILEIVTSLGAVRIEGISLVDGHAVGVGNSGAGGAIFHFGTGSLFIQSCVLRDNLADTFAGAIYHGNGVLEIRDSGLTGNTSASGGTGGGAIVNSATLNIVNTSISGNSSPNAAAGNGGGGGIVNFAQLNLSHSTITGNRTSVDAGGGGIDARGNETITHSIIAGNFVGTGTTPSDIGGGSVDTATHNLIGDAATSGGITDGTGGNVVGNAGTGTRDIATVLDPVLADNGGLTPTHKLVVGSPAIDAGSASFDANAFTPALSNDQRGAGFTRVRKGLASSPAARIDIGAYELIEAPVFTNDDLEINTGSMPLDLATASGVTPPGGTFSGGTGVSGGFFDPTGLALGAYTVTYTVGDTNGTNSTDLTVTVTERPSLTVTSTSDTISKIDGQTTLREALAYAATLTGAQTVDFSNTTANGAVNFHDAVSETILLGGTELEIIGNVTVEGPGADLLTIDGNDASRVFLLPGLDPVIEITLRALTVANGASTNGAGVHVRDGILKVENCAFEDNVATGGGGAIDSDAVTLEVIDSVFLNNGAEEGGAVFIDSDGVCRRCHFEGNSTVEDGGAVSFSGASFVISESTFIANEATDEGGAIDNNGNDLLLVNCTLSGNTAGTAGGGINNQDVLTLVNCTVVGNRADADGVEQSPGTPDEGLGGGGIRTDDDRGVVTLYNTIVAGNRRGAPGSDVAADLSTALPMIVGVDPASAYNLIGDPGFVGELVHGVNGNIVGKEDGAGPRIEWPLAEILDPVLAANGGPTLTHALAPGSPAIDAGDNALAEDETSAPLATDQRGAGFVRITLGLDSSSVATVDMGAYELFAAPIFTKDDLRISVDGAPVDLAAATGVSPAGGIFSGPGVSGGIFDPKTQAPGIYTLTYTITDVFGVSNSAEFTVSVEALEPSLTLTQPKRFKTTVVGASSRSQRVYIRNVGGLPAKTLRVEVSGRAKKDFIVTQPEARSLEAGESTFFQVAFRPRAQGNRKALVTVSSDSSPVSVKLKGRALSNGIRPPRGVK